MTKVLIIDKSPSKINFEKEFIELVNKGIEVHVDCLTQDKVKTLRKADITIDYSSIFDYDHVILVGADSLKVFSESKGINDVSGKLVVSKAIEGKKHESMFAIASFAQLYYKPELKPVIKESVDNICNIIINGKPEVKEGDYRPITDEQEAIDYIVNYASKAKVIGLDSETSAFYPRDGRVLGLCISHQEYQGVYIAAEAFTDTAVLLFQQVLDNPSIEVVLHNAKFDLKFLEYHFGLSFEKAFSEKRLHDSLLLHYVLDERRGTHGLKPLAIKYTDMGDFDHALDQFKKQYCQTHKVKQEDFSYELIPFDIMWQYSARDPDATLRLFNKFKPLVYANPRLRSLYENIMIPGTRFLNRMEERGVPVSLERLEKAKQALYSQIEHLRTQMFETPEVKKFIEVYGTEPNFNSPIQLRNFLYDICKIPPIQKYTDSGALSTDAEVLQKLGEKYDIAKQLLELRKASKILNTYIIKMIDNVDRDGRLRTGFNLFTTTSGRLSSAGKLNLQQLPRDNPIVKGMIKAPPGYKIVAQDMETAEVWVAAALSRDKNLMAVFQELRAGAGNAVSADQ